MSAVHHAFELATGPILTVAGAEPQARTVTGEAARAVYPPPEQAARVSPSERMAARAQELRNTPWMHRGRLAFDGMDWLGFVRDCLQHATARPDLADALGYRASHDAGLSMIAASLLIDDWGLTPVGLDGIEPGDVLLFSMPTAHMGVVTAPARHGSPPRFMHAYWAHAVTESWMGDYWRERLVAAFRLPSALREVGMGEVAA